MRKFRSGVVERKIGGSVRLVGVGIKELVLTRALTRGLTHPLTHRE